MKYVEVITGASSTNTVIAVAQKEKSYDTRLGVEDGNGLQKIRMLVDDDRLQSLLDTLQNVLGSQLSTRIVVLPVEASLPLTEAEKSRKEKSTIAARESLYVDVRKNARLDWNYVVLVFLSTVVASIGLINSNVAVVIGAMVIAPLLGPNLALSLGTALGDLHLMRSSLQTNLAGIFLAVFLSAILGVFWPTELDAPELLLRTEAEFDSIALALASGAAAALSLITGLSSVLVGVMVAVALLPPAATLGLMLGSGNFTMAAGAALLLAINIVCVNLASNLVFLVKGISPRAWMEKQKAKKTMIFYVLGWLAVLLILAWFIFLRGTISLD
ncbi:MAG TPA: TIGR00341 family protein [Mariniphaga anaerophila]|uniref:TIGR00341 family protein n=1 Tax=Mariniphaga anaerophila TaxID=1484053 RepID=A0A831LTF8_9BACT|nr:TIGR00341 family protein [Mariniphaga anaerophila]